MRKNTLPEIYKDEKIQKQISFGDKNTIWRTN
jgi:hypothetical protein